jgi:hypothetical protein
MVLIAEGTRDENMRKAAQKKEENMYRSVQRVRRKLPRKTHQDLSNIQNFGITDGNKLTSSSDFIKLERENYRPKMKEIDVNEVLIIENEDIGEIEPSKFRPMGQKGLEDFSIDE